MRKATGTDWHKKRRYSRRSNGEFEKASRGRWSSPNEDFLEAEVQAAEQTADDFENRGDEWENDAEDRAENA